VIVTCEECSTQFQLDDAKVPARGIRVRCSRCKHAFLVTPAGISPSDRIQQAAADALERGASSVPETTRDLPSGAETDDSGAEADWQFNHEFGGRDDDKVRAPDRMAVARDAIDELLGSSGGSGPTPERSRAPRPDPFDRPVPDLRGVGASDLLERPARAPAEAREVEAPRAEPEAPPQTAREDAPDPNALSIGSIFTKAQEIESEAVAAQVAAASVDVEADSASTAWMRRVAAGVGWAVVVALTGAVLYGSAVPGAVASGETAASQRLDGVEATSVEGRWIENVLAGPIYVISGSLRFTGSTPAGSLLAVELLDRQGRALDVPRAPVGPVLAARSLREEDPALLTKTHAQAALRLARVPLAGGERRRFQAVFADVPPAAVAFRLVEGPGAPAAAPSGGPSS
jgi:predicted Zn finger-like uncharacterized protein